MAVDETSAQPQLHSPAAAISSGDSATLMAMGSAALIPMLRSLRQRDGVDLHPHILR